MTAPDPSLGPFELATTPFAKYGEKPQYHIATQMCLAHNMQIRSLNAIYLQATSISKPQDIADFLVYCQCWYEVLHHHHKIEEDFFFPELEKRLSKPGSMDTSVEQHRAFHDPLEVWGKQCYELSPDRYDGKEWQRLIDDFATPLLKHLHDEVDVLVELASLDPDGAIMATLWKELDAKAMKEADKYRTFPLGLGAVDAGFEGGMHHFPPVPLIAMYVVDWIFARKFRGAWRFAPSDMHSRPRPLQFVSAHQGTE